MNSDLTQKRVYMNSMKQHRYTISIEKLFFAREEDALYWRTQRVYTSVEHRIRHDIGRSCSTQECALEYWATQRVYTSDERKIGHDVYRSCYTQEGAAFGNYTIETQEIFFTLQMYQTRAQGVRKCLSKYAVECRGNSNILNTRCPTWPDDFCWLYKCTSPAHLAT